MKTSMVLAAVAFAMSTAACGADTGYDPGKTGIYVYNGLDIGATTSVGPAGEHYSTDVLVDRFVSLPPGEYDVGGARDIVTVTANEVTQVPVALLVVRGPASLDESFGVTDKDLSSGAQPGGEYLVGPWVLTPGETWSAVFGWNTQYPDEQYVPFHRSMGDGEADEIDVGAIKVMNASTCLDAYRVGVGTSERIRSCLAVGRSLALPQGTYELRREDDGTVVRSNIEIVNEALTIVY